MNNNAIVDRILEMHRIGCEIDEQVQTCGMGKTVKPQWHIFKYEDFIKAAKEFGTENAIRVHESHSSLFREFEYRGVRVLCLTNISGAEEYDDDIDTAD